jgi:hypothetical protein
MPQISLVKMLTDVQGDFESCADILIMSHWFHVEFGKIFKKFCQEIK